MTEHRFSIEQGLSAVAYGSAPSLVVVLSYYIIPLMTYNVVNFRLNYHILQLVNHVIMVIGK
jgi:hypothetical protein